MLQPRVNWPIAIPLTLLGLVCLWLALELDENAGDVRSSILVEVGVALCLLSGLALLERRVVRHVAETASRAAEQAARDETRRVTGDLQARVERLEDLDSAQRREREAQRDLLTSQSQAILDGAITSTTIGDLLVSAIEDRLIDEDRFYVRTSPADESPILFILPFVDARRVIAVYLDFEPIEIDSQPLLLDEHVIPVPRRTDSVVMWMDEPAYEIAAQLQAGLERRNRPTDGFGFGYTLDRLVSSIEIMRDARAAVADDPRRLRGRLRTLVNDDWAYTTEGLEAIATDDFFPVQEAGWMERGSGVAQAFGSHMFVPESTLREAPEPLAHAFDWLEARERVRILRPGDNPIRSLFGNANERPASREDQSV